MVGTIALLGCGALFRCPIEGCTFEKEQPQNVLKPFVRHRDKRNAESSQLEELESQREREKVGEEERRRGGTHTALDAWCSGGHSHDPCREVRRHTTSPCMWGE